MGHGLTQMNTDKYGFIFSQRRQDAIGVLMEAVNRHRLASKLNVECLFKEKKASLFFSQKGPSH
jgi:hypothetical protein